MKRVLALIVTAGSLPVADPALSQQTTPEPARILALREQMEDLRLELERRAERRELIERQERALYEIALAVGLEATLPADHLYPVDVPRPDLLANGGPDLRVALSGGPVPADPTGERTRALDGFRQWLGRAGRGEVRLESLDAAASEVRQVAAAQRTALGPAIGDERESHDEILRLTTDIRRTIESIETPLDETIAGDLDALLQSLDDVRAVVEGDELVGRATMVDAALEGLLRARTGPGSR
jgi:hypothetical protein